MCLCLSDGYVNKESPNYPLYNEVIECFKKISTTYTLRLFVETCYLQIHCFEMEENSISPEWEGMNIASELCYSQAFVSLNGALYQLAISIKWVCLMWVYVHVCAWDIVCVCCCPCLCVWLFLCQSLWTRMYFACSKMMRTVQKDNPSNSKLLKL